ncbi:MAG: PepSY domain-containing protein [Gammaproteobacteria bacterium]
MKSRIIMACLIVHGQLLTAPVSAVLQPGSLMVAEVTLEQAARMVQGNAGGRILGAETRDVGGRTVHIIKILTADGKRVRYIQVDAQTGRVMGGR